MTRYRLNIEYDGTFFRGWQMQPDAPTVQEEIERALTTLFGGREIRIMGSGRTDTGVHAVGQVAHAELPEDRDPGKLLRGLEGQLPEGVRVWRVEPVGEEFHARFDARERQYAYRILKRPNSFLGRYGWLVPYPVKMEQIIDATPLLLGKYNFRPFSTRPDDEESTDCELRTLEWREDRFGWVLHLAADRYLRRMVRTLVGTLVEIGGGRREVETLQTLLSQGIGRAGVPAPPQGLALMRVRYDIDDAEDSPEPSLWGEFS
ncbi:tRNA pseudouridine(38-40) synthase TruA [bacterium]|nr:tRNA pseudouridine(38-40) synthase TruA [bacterium]